MQFLIDADLPRSCADLIRRYGHEATDVRDIGLGSADDSIIASYAKAHDLCIITGDYDFADIRNYPPHQYAGLIILYIPNNASASFILNLLETFLKQDQIIADLAQKLIIVEPGQIRIRIS